MAGCTRFQQKQQDYTDITMRFVSKECYMEFIGAEDMTSKTQEEELQQ